jgi:hypothetical protein
MVLKNRPLRRIFTKMVRPRSLFKESSNKIVRTFDPKFKNQNSDKLHFCFFDYDF